MPLFDHFHPPMKDLLPWESLLSGWTTHLADALNEQWLPPPVIAFERRYTHSKVAGSETVLPDLPRIWPPPGEAFTIPTVFPDVFEVRVYAGSGGWELLAAIEWISPGNKDRVAEREAFASKCASYLHQGVSVALIDVVTSCRANLHNELLRRLQVTDERIFFPDDVYLYAAAYRPVLRDERPEIDVWRQACVVGEPLPGMPLRLTGDLFVPVEFEAAYLETCRRRRVI